MVQAFMQKGLNQNFTKNEQNVAKGHQINDTSNEDAEGLYPAEEEQNVADHQKDVTSCDDADG